MNAQPPRIAARNARNRQRDRALRAALTANTIPSWQERCLMTTTLVDDLRTARSRGVRPEAPDADLRGADLWGANLRGADLREADLRGADLWGAEWHGLRIDGLPSGQVTLMPTPDGWDLTIGCWQHKTLADLAALIAGEITPPEARGPEIERRRPSWVAVLALCEAHAGMHPDVIEALAAKWGQAS